MKLSHVDTRRRFLNVVRHPTIPRWTDLVLALGIAASGCSMNAALRQGQVAERERNYDEAVLAYTRALQENPRDRETQLSLERAKLRAAQLHYTEGRRLTQRGEY